MSNEATIDRPVGLPNDATHQRAYQVAHDLMNGQISGPAQDILRDALDKAPTGAKYVVQVGEAA